ncbi:unnamed protein product [Euphydryas editha]|uniref:Uncharacterized protein n=1 Tax=Euphydryas editha TaxID=104508 RepID=A0AAU9TRV9_EUPED|nr:unnamed protein product [Euphydryas editha]
MIKCKIYVNSLYSTKEMWFHKLVTIRDMGGLCYASENLFSVCLKFETVIKPHLNKNSTHFVNNQVIERLKCNILKTFLNSNVFDSISEHSKDQAPAFNHRVHLIKTIIDKYTTVRLHSAYKNNPEIKKLSKRQKRNKLNLFEGV